MSVQAHTQRMHLPGASIAIAVGAALLVVGLALAAPSASAQGPVPAALGAVTTTTIAEGPTELTTTTTTMPETTTTVVLGPDEPQLPATGAGWNLVVVTAGVTLMLAGLGFTLVARLRSHDRAPAGLR